MNLIYSLIIGTFFIFASSCVQKRIIEEQGAHSFAAQAGEEGGEPEALSSLGDCLKEVEGKKKNTKVLQGAIEPKKATASRLHEDIQRLDFFDTTRPIDLADSQKLYDINSVISDIKQDVASAKLTEVSEKIAELVDTASLEKIKFPKSTKIKGEVDNIESLGNAAKKQINDINAIVNTLSGNKASLSNKINDAAKDFGVHFRDAAGQGKRDHLDDLIAKITSARTLKEVEDIFNDPRFFSLRAELRAQDPSIDVLSADIDLSFGDGVSAGVIYDAQQQLDLIDTNFIAGAPPLPDLQALKALAEQLDRTLENKSGELRNSVNSGIVSPANQLKPQLNALIGITDKDAGTVRQKISKHKRNINAIANETELVDLQYYFNAEHDPAAATADLKVLRKRKKKADKAFLGKAADSKEAKAVSLAGALLKLQGQASLLAAFYDGTKLTAIKNAVINAGDTTKPPFIKNYRDFKDALKPYTLVGLRAVLAKNNIEAMPPSDDDKTNPEVIFHHAFIGFGNKAEHLPLEVFKKLKEKKHDIIKKRLKFLANEVLNAPAIVTIATELSRLDKLSNKPDEALKEFTLLCPQIEHKLNPLLRKPINCGKKLTPADPYPIDSLLGMIEDELAQSALQSDAKKGLQMRMGAVEKAKNLLKRDFEILEADLRAMLVVPVDPILSNPKKRQECESSQGIKAIEDLEREDEKKTLKVADFNKALTKINDAFLSPPNKIGPLPNTHAYSVTTLIDDLIASLRNDDLGDGKTGPFTYEGVLQLYESQLSPGMTAADLADLQAKAKDNRSGLLKNLSRALSPTALIKILQPLNPVKDSDILTNKKVVALASVKTNLGEPAGIADLEAALKLVANATDELKVREALRNLATFFNDNPPDQFNSKILAIANGALTLAIPLPTMTANLGMEVKKNAVYKTIESVSKITQVQKDTTNIIGNAPSLEAFSKKVPQALEGTIFGVGAKNIITQFNALKSKIKFALETIKANTPVGGKIVIRDTKTIEPMVHAYSIVFHYLLFTLNSYDFSGPDDLNINKIHAIFDTGYASPYVPKFKGFRSSVTRFEELPPAPPVTLRPIVKLLEDLQAKMAPHSARTPAIIALYNYINGFLE